MNDDVLLTIAGTTLGAVVTALGAWLLKYLPLRSKLTREEEELHRRWSREDRADTLSEYQVIVERYRNELIELDRERTAEVSVLNERIRELSRENRALLVEQERLRGEIKLLTAQVVRLQAMVGDVDPTSSLPALVVAGADGVIRHASPSVSPMFRCLPESLVGQRISMLMPERYRSLHEAALARLREQTEVVWGEKVVMGHALRQDTHEEFPVAILLSNFKSDNGELYVAAEIRHRTGMTHELPTREPGA